MKRFNVLQSLAVLFLFSQIVWGTVPRLINFQGILKDGTGNPVANGSYSVTFTIYGVPVGGTALWTETQSISTTGGLFAVLLGSTNPVPDSAFKGPDRYLGIAVSPDGEMPQRQRLVSVGYSYRVNSVDSSLGGTIKTKVSIGPGHLNIGANAFVAGQNDTAYGDFAAIGGGKGNRAIQEYAAIAGGENNTGWNHASIGGGMNNNATSDFSAIGGGKGNQTLDRYAVTAGGENNTAWDHASVGGGINNIASGDYATISGGYNNVASATRAVVSGGGDNLANAGRATVGGGEGDTTSGEYSTIGGGEHNLATEFRATIGGGGLNTASGSSSTVAGGQTNVASGGRSTVGGGEDNIASGDYATIAGGFDNLNWAYKATVGGGWQNVSDGWYGVVAGGYLNHVGAYGSTVSGGENNTASGLFAVVAGGGGGIDSMGAGNAATGVGSTVGGGSGDSASGDYSTVPGGFLNAARGAFSFAAGFNAKANHGGSVVIAANNSTLSSDSIRSGGTYQMIFRADGGIWITNTGGLATYDVTKLINTSSGAYLTTGGTWTNASSRSYKTDIQPLKNKEYSDILEKLEKVDVVRFKYKKDPGREHIGLIAEDVPEEIASDDRTGVPTADAIAFLMAAVKAQQSKIQELEETIKQLKDDR